MEREEREEVVWYGLFSLRGVLVFFNPYSSFSNRNFKPFSWQAFEHRVTVLHQMKVLLPLFPFHSQLFLIFFFFVVQEHSCWGWE